MDKKTFAAMVSRRKPPEVSDDCLNAAIDFFAEQEWMQQSDVAACIQLAGRFAVFSAASEGHIGMSGRQLEPLTPGILVLSDDLIRRITPSVEQVRQALFGNTDAPFSSYEQVAAWLEQMGQHQAYTIHYKECSVDGHITYQPTLIIQDPQLDQQCQAIHQNIQELYRQWGELTGERVLPSLPRKCRYLPYVRRDAKDRLWPEDFPACAGSPLAKLYDSSHIMAEATGFSQHSVVMYILMGSQPLLSPFTVRHERKPYPIFGRSRVQVAIEIETPDITDEQWRGIRQITRQAWEVDNTTRLDADDQQLQNIVTQLGGVPQERGKMAFWEQACQEWNRQEGQKAKLKQQQGCIYTPNLHKNGQATRMRYVRLTQKLDRQVSGAGKQWPPTMTSVGVMSGEGITHTRNLRNNKTKK